MRNQFQRPQALAPLLALLLAGCGGGGGGSSSSPSPAPAGPLSVSAAAPDGLTATLAEDRSAISTGGSVTYTLTLANNTSQAITYSPTSGAVPTGSNAFAVGGSLAITSHSGAAVYPPQTGGATPAIVGFGQPVTLAPGQSATGTVAPGGVFSAPGTYAATATFDYFISSQPIVQQATVGPLTVTVQ